MRKSRAILSIGKQAGKLMKGAKMIASKSYLRVVLEEEAANLKEMAYLPDDTWAQ